MIFVPPPAVIHLVLLGPMGVGKTTTGRRLAETLERPFIDCDDQIEDRTGQTSRDVAAAAGVAVLHELEAEVLHAALDSTEPAVVTAAASAVDRSRGRAALAKQTCVLLRAPAAVIAARSDEQPHRRPTDPSERERLLRGRWERWLRLSAVVVDVGSLPPDVVVATILDGLGFGAAGE